MLTNWGLRSKISKILKWKGGFLYLSTIHDLESSPSWVKWFKALEMTLILYSRETNDIILHCVTRLPKWLLLQNYHTIGQDGFEAITFMLLKLYNQIVEHAKQ